MLRHIVLLLTSPILSLHYHWVSSNNNKVEAFVFPIFSSSSIKSIDVISDRISRTTDVTKCCMSPSQNNNNGGENDGKNADDDGKDGSGPESGEALFNILKDQLGGIDGVNILFGPGSGGNSSSGGDDDDDDGTLEVVGGNDRSNQNNIDLEELKRFDLKPKEVVEHLNRFVIRQDDAKKVLAVAICDHYNHCRRCLKESEEDRHKVDDPFQDPSMETKAEYAKPNVLLAGPTGVGKTYLLKCLARLVGVPFVKADATKFSETGIVGRDAEDLVRDLVDSADGNVELASMGIIYLDEVDKIAGGSGGGASLQGSFNTKGVQNNFLKLLEDTDVSLERPNEFSLQGALGGGMGGPPSPKSISTRNILFIFSGAFTSLDKELRNKREKKSFGLDLTRATTSSTSNTEIFDDDNNDDIWDNLDKSNNKKKNGDNNDKEKSGSFGIGGNKDINRPAGKGRSYLRFAETADFVRAGLEPEFVGRVPVRVSLDGLDSSDLKQILTRAEGSVLKQFKRDFEGYGISMNATDDALTEIARLAADEGTGARGLVTILERTLREHKYELPSTSISSFNLDERTVKNPVGMLKGILQSESAASAAGVRLLDLKRWERNLERSLPESVCVWLTSEAQDVLIKESMENNESTYTLVGRRFGDFLPKVINRIYDETGQTSHPIGVDMAKDPKAVLREYLDVLDRAKEKKMKNESLSSSTASDNSTVTTGSSIADDEKILPKIKKVRDSDDDGEQK